MVNITIQNLNAWFGNFRVLKDINMSIYAGQILSVIGPANSGKTSFLRTLNRLNELEPNFYINGKVNLDKQDIFKMPVESLRKKVGMVFAMPSPLPLTIFDNVAYGVRISGIRCKKELSEIVENSLQEAHLWDEVRDRLDSSAFNLSGGQQQRLCIARTLAVKPEIILFDEPCSGLDPISTGKVEDTMFKLKQKFTQVLVTNNVKQAARVGDKTAFFLNGELVELDVTDKIFTAPGEKRTEDYVSGKFG